VKKEATVQEKMKKKVKAELNEKILVRVSGIWSGVVNFFFHKKPF
jgi:hypothetical protein